MVKRLSFGAGLVNEFIRHLEEETLASTQPLEESDALILSRYKLVFARVDELVRLTRAVIAERWEAYDTPDWRNYANSPDFWEHCPKQTVDQPASVWPDDCFFEWHGRPDVARWQPQGEWVFGAGVAFHRNRAPTEVTHGDWLHALYEQGFEYGDRRGMQFLWRYLSPDEIVGHGDLSEQAKALASWVVETFRLLAGTSPPSMSSL